MDDTVFAYKTLLMKFVLHVKEMSGESFIAPHYKDNARFSGDEWAKLEEYAKIPGRQRIG
jgi:hypothetical protein